MSIIPDKFRDKTYKGAEDWISTEFLAKHAMTPAVPGKKAEPDSPAVKAEPAKINVTALFDLAAANGVDAEHLRPGSENHGAAGRIKMTIANMLRSRAKKRGGLFDVNKKWHKAPAEFMVDKDGNPIEAVHDKDGNWLSGKAPAKPEKPAKVEAANTAEAPAKEEKRRKKAA